MWILYAAVLWKYQTWIAIGVLTWFLYKLEVHQLIVSWWRARKARLAADRAEAELAAYRAEQENREWLRGGLYEGQYPGATLPLTTQEPRAWYDYDDGLTEWP